MKIEQLKSNETLSFLRPDQYVIDSTALESLSRSTLPDQVQPSYMTFPETQGDVQNIVRFANRQQIPVWYVSTGKNWGYGDRAAPYSGGITMVMERMKRIYEVNSKLGYAVIEPGVTYSELNDHLKKTGSPLWTDAAGTTEHASIIGNALDKGRGLTPYADHFGMLCGFDVVLPSGELMSTAPSANYQCHHLYKWGIGPYMDGLFTQSNLGIVVKAGVWLMPKPEQFGFFAFEYKANENQFAQFIESFRDLVFKGGLLSRPHLANDFAMLCIVDQYPHHLLKSQGKTLSEMALSQWKKKHGVHDWTFGGGLYGTPKQIRSQKELVKKHLGRFGSLRFLGDIERETNWSSLYRKLVVLGARLEGKSEEFIKQIFPAMNLFKGIPTDEFAKQVYFKSTLDRPQGRFNPAQDRLGFIWTGPLVPFTSEAIKEVLDEAKSIFALYQFDLFVELIVESPRAVIALFGVFFEPKSPDETERARNWYQHIRRRMISLGYSPYRETSSSTVKALEGNVALKKTLAKIKEALDENNILAPGRYGIDK